jgi:hypothetical protein
MNDRDRHRVAAHAMQSGVAAEMQIEDRQTSTEPKHLRVGINAAMSDHAGLVRLLIAKGVITEGEYLKAIADEMESEKARYENSLSQHFGKKITLA